MLLLHRSRQLDVHDANAHPFDNGVHRIVARAVDCTENRNRTRLAFDRCQFIFDTGTNSGIAIEIELTATIEFQETTMIGKDR